MGHRTKIRVSGFKCGHKGLGASCNRCLQANELETRANELTTLLKNNKEIKEEQFPKYVSMVKTAVCVKAGAERVMIHLSDDGKKKITLERALEMAVHTMRTKSSNRLKV